MAAMGSSALRRALRVGLVGGVVVVYVSATGIIHRFNSRNIITGVITLGYVLLIIVSATVGYRAARPPQRGGQLEHGVGTVGAGSLAGLVTGTVLAAFLLGMNALLSAGGGVRRIFINISPDLLDILSFGRGAGMGALYLAGGGALLGALAGALTLVPRPRRRSILIALLAVLLTSLGEPFFRPMLSGLGNSLGLPFIENPRWLYQSGGLTLTAAIAICAITLALVEIWSRGGRVVKARLRALPASQRQTGKLVAFAVLLAFLLILPQIVGAFLSQVIGTVGLYVLLGLGLNIVVGFAGLLDLGYVAFFAVGAYTTAVLTSPRSAFNDGSAGIPYWVVIPAVIVVAALAGLLIGAPVLRLRGDYLAIVTLGFGEIARVIVAADATKRWLGGPQGILSVPSPQLGGIDLGKPEFFYYMIVVFCLLAVYVSVRLQNSRVGRAWAAMREDESVAEAMGISVIRYKLLAFAIGGGVGSLSGALFAARIGSVFPGSFLLLVSITVLAVLILGGMGSIRGVIVGAAVLVGLPELLREFAEFRLLFYGAILVAIMILRPEGLLPDVRRRRELHEPVAEGVPEAGIPPPVVTAGGSV